MAMVSVVGSACERSGDAAETCVSPPSVAVAGTTPAGRGGAQERATVETPPARAG